VAQHTATLKTEAPITSEAHNSAFPHAKHGFVYRGYSSSCRKV